MPRGFCLACFCLFFARKVPQNWFDHSWIVQRQSFTIQPILVFNRFSLTLIKQFAGVLLDFFHVLLFQALILRLVQSGHQGRHWENPKQHMKLQQPRNYDFWMFQFNLLGSQGGNSREMTTSPPGHYWEVTVALTTAAKLLQVRANSREMTSQKLNEEHEILRRCMAVVVSSAFWASLRHSGSSWPCGLTGGLVSLRDPPQCCGLLCCSS